MVIVENDDGDTTFVRDAWLERGEVNVLWFEPYLDRTPDSAIALQSWLTRATALATDDKPATAIVPLGVKLLSGTPLTFGSNLHFFGGVSAVGGGEIAAHGDLPLSASLLSNINLPVAGERKEKNIRFVNLVVDGEARTYPARLSNPDAGEAIVGPEKDYYDASTNPTGWIGNPSYDADDDSLVTSLPSPSGTFTLNGTLVSGGAATIDPVRRVITSAQNYAGGTGLRMTGNRASFVDACGINCHGMFDGKIDDNWIFYAFKNSNLKYPYGPFSERHSFGVGIDPIAGQAVEATAPLDARSHGKFPLSGSISHNVIGDSRGVANAPDAAIYLG